MPALFRHVPAAGAAPGYFQLVNAAGVAVADSRDKLLRITNVLIGSVQPPIRNTPVSTSTTYTLGSCDAAADLVFGYARCSYSGTPLDGIPATGWFNVGGTYVHVFGTGQFNQATNVSAVVGYSFQAAAGSVTMIERVTMTEYKTDTGQTLQYGPPEIFYELWIGSFV